MNAERLHAIVIALNKEMAEKKMPGMLQDMVGHLRTVVQQTNQQSYQQNLSASLNSLYAALTDTPSDKFSPAWRQILSELGGEPFFGRSLKENIEGTLAKNQLTPAVALDALEKLLAKLNEFKKALDQVQSAFVQFKIGSEKLAPGEAEIGILIPRNAVKNQLPAFAEELTELEFILNTFSEVATGKKDPLEIRTISSSNLLVHLNAAVPFAACLALGIERVVALYKQILEIRKIRQDLKKQGVPEAQTKGIEDYANGLMENGIDKVSVEIVNNYYKQDDKPRKNELTTAVRLSLNKIANRIDQGFNIEVRVEPITAKTAENEDLRKAIALIQSASANMQYLKLEGPPLLSLPESKEKPKKKGESHESKPKGT